jgi:hypothetical protein
MSRINVTWVNGWPPGEQWTLRATRCRHSDIAGSAGPTPTVMGLTIGVIIAIQPLIRTDGGGGKPKGDLDAEPS